MKTIRLFAFFLAAIALLATTGCNNDDDDNGPDTSSIVGTWLSTGANVAPLLSAPPLNIRTITATFQSNNTYVVRSTDASGGNIEFRGTYTTTRSSSGNISTIRLEQQQPAALVSEGIFEITVVGNTTTMRYEVAQTTPSIPGVTAPTPAAGFGSTSGGALGNINIQTYVKQ